MISSVTVRRFKVLNDLTLDMAALTVLTGRNSAGKTSVVQSLLLPRIAKECGGVPLNGPYGLALGEASDVLTSEADASEGIEVILNADCQVFPWKFGVAEGERRGYLELIDQPTALFQPYSGTSRDFVFLCAERCGPRDVFVASAEPTGSLGVGYAGQHTAQVLATAGTLPVSAARRHPVRTPRDKLIDLQHQTEWWLGSIVRESEIKAEWYPGTSVISLRFRAPGFRSEWTRPANTGFGVSYALPVIVAGLITPRHGMILVENPEAHLHPSGQQAMGRFLATVASDGVQVVVETHSDHVVNGIRVAVREGLLPPHSLITHFFANSPEVGMPVQISSPQIDANGRFNIRPEGFFDEWDRALADLLRPRG